MSFKDDRDTVTETSRHLPPNEVAADEETAPITGSPTVEGAQVFRFAESRKLGVTSSLFLILNKMIGTGSQSFGIWVGSDKWRADSKS